MMVIHLILDLVLSLVMLSGTQNVDVGYLWPDSILSTLFVAPIYGITSSRVYHLIFLCSRFIFVTS